MSLLFCIINFRSQWLEHWFSFYAYLGINQDHFLFQIIPTSHWEKQTRLAWCPPYEARMRPQRDLEHTTPGPWLHRHPARGSAGPGHPVHHEGRNSVSSHGSAVLKHLLFLQKPSSFIRVSKRTGEELNLQVRFLRVVQTDANNRLHTASLKLSSSERI